MSKRDELLRAGAGHMLESMGARTGGALPAGMEGVGALKKPAHLEGTTRERGALRIATGRIIPDPDQPRTEFDEEELARLAESLRDRGQLQPIRVRWDEGRGAYVIIMGERRWRAAQRAGLEELSCIVHEGPLDPGQTLILQLIENCLRQDLTPLEQARAYERLMRAEGWSARQLSAELAVAPSTVTRALSLLELPAAVQEQVEAGTLAAHTAYEVSKLPDPEAQAVVAQAAVEQKLTRTEVDELVRAVRAKRPAPPPRPDPLTLEVEPGVTVTIRWKKGGGPDELAVLKKAVKLLQERRRDEQAA